MTDTPASLYSPDEPDGRNADRLPRPSDVEHAIPEFARGEWRFGSYRVTEVRKQLQKRIVFGELAYRDGARREKARVVTKVYGSDRGERALVAIRRLWTAGFRPPSSERVPRPFGYEQESGALYQGHAPGTPLADLLPADPRRLAAASRRAASWLLRLQHTTVDGTEEGPDATALTVRRTADEIGAAFPEQRARILALGAGVAAELAAEVPRLTPSHGDFHAKNVFLAPRFVTAIDFDTFALREPAHDVGYAIAQLLIMSHMRHGTIAHGMRAARGFWSTFDDGAMEWRRVRLHVGRTFLQSLRFELCTMRTGRLELLSLWPALAERAVVSATASRFLRSV